MPKKGKKRGIGRKSAAADIMKRARASETLEERNSRLTYAKKSDAERRKNETSEERSQRNDYKKERTEYTRENESPAQKSVRLSQQRDRQRLYDRNRFQKAIKENKGLGFAKDTDLFQESEFPENLRKHELPSLYDAEICPHCRAYRWKQERKGFCCQNGNVSLPKIKEFPQELKELYTDKNFLNNIRSYNNSLALASIGCDEKILPGFNPTFKIQGKVFHTIGSLNPENGQTPKFAQLYFYDTDNEIQNRLQHNPHLKPDVLEKLQKCLKSVNPYVKSLEYASTLSNEQPDVRIVICAEKKPKDEHSRKYNLPLASEVSVVMPGEQEGHLDVVIKRKGGELQRINSLHRSYDPLHYVLLFPHGDDGYTDDIKRTNRSKDVSGQKSSKRVSGAKHVSDKKDEKRVSVAEYYSIDCRSGREKAIF